MRFQQVGLRVTNLPRSLRFYTKLLGLTEVARGDTRSWGGGRWVQLKDPRSGSPVELNWYPEGSRFGPPFRPGDSTDHLDFTLGAAPVDQLEAIYRRLLRGGAGPTECEPSTTGGWMASVTDPDGVWITIGRRPTRAEQRRMAGAVRPARRRRPG